MTAIETAQDRVKEQYRPYALLAELTYRCPLHCPYCSNPTVYPTGKQELTTAEWQRVFYEASELGVMHLFLSGGEPLLRPDIVELVASARANGLYSNLITSSLGLTPVRAEALKKAGLDSVQISFQAEEEVLANSIAGTQAHARKREAARLVRELDFPLTVNVVLHQRNIERLEGIIALAEEFGAERLELANTQFYGWAFKNKSLLLPTRAQLAAAEQVASAAAERLRGKMEVLYILPDYYGERPKPCMNGWGRRYITVNPVGSALPCPTAGEIKTLQFDNIKEHSLSWIWHNSAAFNEYRGTAWLPEPCQSCERREIDFGGCRCQAALLTGEAGNTDPACSLAPHRAKLLEIVSNIEQQKSAQLQLREEPEYQYRQNPSGS